MAVNRARHFGNRPPALILVASALAMVGVASCSSSSKSTGATSTDSTPAGQSSVANVSYTGPEANLPTSYSVTKPAKSFTIGWEIINPNSETSAQADAAKAETERLGGSFKTLNDNGEPSTQLRNCKLLVSEHVSAIVVYPFVPHALAPCFDAAAAQGIMLVAQQDPPSAAPAPLPAHLTTSVLQAWDYGAYLRCQAAAKADPGGSFAMIGLGIPIAAFDYSQGQMIHWCESFGLHYLGLVNASAESASATDTAMTSVLVKSPTVGTVFTLDDVTALPASVVARTSQNRVHVIGGGGQGDAISAIKQGHMYGTLWVDFAAEGKNLADAAVNLINGHPVPKYVTTPVKIVTAANADSVKGWG